MDWEPSIPSLTPIMMRRLSALLVACCLAVTARAQVTFAFDYTYDDNNFFSNANIGNRAYLEAAGTYVSNLISSTSLSAITPDSNNSWNAQVFDPRDVNSTLDIGNISVAANTILVFAGGYTLGGSTLGGIL